MPLFFLIQEGQTDNSDYLQAEYYNQDSPNKDFYLILIILCSHFAVNIPGPAAGI